MAAYGGAKTLLAIALLVASVVTDLRTRKVPNKLLLSALVLAFIAVILLDGVSGLWPALGSMAAALACTMPLYLVRGIGAGDAKLILVASLLLPWLVSLEMVIFSLIWGSLLGVFRAVLAGQGRGLATNMLSILRGKKPADQQLHQIPYTVAILIGLLSSLGFSRVGWVWL